MIARKRQILTLSVLGTIFVVLLAHRLARRADVPATAFAGVTPESILPADSMNAIENVAREETWRLPGPEQLRSVLVTDWSPPANNPFQMSDRILDAVGADKPKEQKDRAGQQGAKAPAVSRPGFAVRSTFSVAGRWFAEIDDQVYHVGDAIQGFMITEISDDSVRVASLEDAGDDRADAWDPATSQPRCVIRVGPAVMAYSGGRWLPLGDPADDQATTPAAGSTREFELTVGDDPD